LNPASGTQPIREGVDLQNTIKNRKGDNFTEATRRDWDVKELSRGLAGREY
jgi:hypothetical protein